MLKSVPMFLISVASAAAQTYGISTFAGGSVPTPGITAAAWGMGMPGQVSVDSAGNFYVAAPSINQVWVMNPAGIVTQIIGNGTPGFSGDNGPVASAQLNNPQGVAADSLGNIYIADTGNGSIRKISNGIITSIASNGLANVYLSSPLAVDSANNLYFIGSARIVEISTNGSVSTVAGNGTPGYRGDGGPATSAEIEPVAIAFDSRNNLYIADGSNNAVREVSGGVISTIVKGLNNASGVAVDTAGTVYISTYSHDILKFSGGKTSVFAGTGVPGFSDDGGSALQAMFYVPTSLAVDPGGNFYVVDSQNHRVRRISNGIVTTIAANGTFQSGGDGGPPANAELNSPFGVALDSTGSAYITDSLACSIRKVAGGVINTFAGEGTCSGSAVGPALSVILTYPNGVAVGSNGTVYLSFGAFSPTYSYCEIAEVAGGIATPLAGGMFTCGSNYLYFPTGVALDSGGNPYVADSQNYLVKTISNGNITTVAGNGSATYSGDGGSPLNAGLGYVSSVAFDSQNNLYIGAGNRIRKVSNGIITTIAGNGVTGFSGDGGLAINAALSGAYGIAVDSSGNVYFSDLNNQRVRMISNAIITTIAGNGIAGFSGDGGNATSGQLNNPHNLAVDSGGNIYVADSGNNRIRELTPATRYPLTAGISPAAGGTLSVTSGTYYAAGSVVSVQATANPGYQFANFSGALTGSANPQSITIVGPANLVANFTPVAPALAASVGVRATGTGSAVTVTVTLTNTGLGTATNATVTSIAGIADVAGSGSVSVTAGTPVNIGTIGPTSTGSAAIAFNWPVTATRVTFRVNFTADGGYSGSSTIAAFR